MRAADLGDAVALEADAAIFAALLADYQLALQERRDVSPDGFMEAHRSAGVTLADRILLAVDGDVEPAEFERVACVRLLAWLDTTMRRCGSVREGWIDAGATELCRAFRERMDAHYRAPAGGTA